MTIIVGKIILLILMAALMFSSTIYIICKIDGGYILKFKISIAAEMALQFTIGFFGLPLSIGLPIFLGILWI